MPGLENIRTAAPVDDYLTDFAVSFREANREGAVADALFVPVPVRRDAGRYTIWSSGNIMTPRSTFWAKGAPTPEMRLRATDDGYLCKKYGMKTSIDDDDRENNQSGAALDQEAVEAVVRMIMLDREIRVNAAVTALTQDIDLPGGTNTQWDEASANPKGNIELGVETIQKATGMKPNLFVMGRSIWTHLRTGSAITGSAAAQLMEAIKYSLPATNGNINAALVAQFLDVERIMVAEMVYDAAIPTTTIDQVNVTGTYIWADDWILVRSEPRPTTTSISFAKSFESDPLHITPRWREEDYEAEFIRARYKVDEKIVTRKCGFLAKNALNLV